MNLVSDAYLIISSSQLGELVIAVGLSGSQTGVRVPLGVRERLTGGTPNFKNYSKQGYLDRIFDLGGLRRG